MKGSSNSSVFFLQIAVAVFFLASGIVGIINYNSTGSELARAFGRLLGGGNSNLNLIIAILELISGGMLLIGSVVSFSGRSGFIAALIIFILWGVKIVYSHVMYNFGQPDILVWIYRLSPDLVILAALWMVTKRNA